MTYSAEHHAELVQAIGSSPVGVLVVGVVIILVCVLVWRLSGSTAVHPRLFRGLLLVAVVLGVLAIAFGVIGIVAQIVH